MPDRNLNCSVRSTLDVIAGRWKPSILYELKDGPKRFSELQAAIEGVSGQALTLQLRQLEADGIISRTVYGEAPVRVEYKMTECGAQLSDVMEQMDAWGSSYRARRLKEL